MAAEAASSFGGVRALCAAAKLVRSTLRFVSLRVLHEEARQEDDALVEAVSPAGPEPEPAGSDAYKHRHSWRRRRSVPVVVVVASTTEEGMPLDITQTRLGYELASLRALGEDRRRQSLLSFLLRVRQNGTSSSDGRIGGDLPEDPPALPVRSDP